jgi:hypothetical protein
MHVVEWFEEKEKITKKKKKSPRKEDKINQEGM